MSQKLDANISILRVKSSRGRSKLVVTGNEPNPESGVQTRCTPCLWSTPSAFRTEHLYGVLLCTWALRSTSGIQVAELGNPHPPSTTLCSTPYCYLPSSLIDTCFKNMCFNHGQNEVAEAIAKQ